MEDYLELLKKYRILIVVYILSFILILYFIWRPKETSNSLFTIQSVTEDVAYERFYDYYKSELDKVFLEGNYQNIYNNYLLDEYKSSNYITLDNVEEVIKYRCDSFASAATTKYTVSVSDNIVVYHVVYADNNAENSLDIYEFSPYNYKIAFGKKIYDSASEESSTNNDTEEESNYITRTDESGLKFEITKTNQTENFLQYDVKITNTSSDKLGINLIQNSNLVLVDSNEKYYSGSISKNDLFNLEKDNYVTFSVSFKVSYQTQLDIKKLKFLKIEKESQLQEIEINI